MSSRYINTRRHKDLKEIMDNLNRDLQDLVDLITVEAKREAFQEGYEKGKEAGYTQGYDDGEKDGKEEEKEEERERLKAKEKVNFT